MAQRENLVLEETRAQQVYRAFEGQLACVASQGRLVSKDQWVAKDTPACRELAAYREKAASPDHPVHLDKTGLKGHSVCGPF